MEHPLCSRNSFRNWSYRYEKDWVPSNYNNVLSAINKMLQTGLGLDSILKSRDISLPTKVRIVKAMVFPVVMYGCEIWTIKKAERRRTDAFELWCWRRLLKSPLDWMEIKLVNPMGNQPWIFIGRADAKAEAPVLWPPDGKSRLIRIKTLMLGKIEGRRRGW